MNCREFPGDLSFIRWLDYFSVQKGFLLLCCVCFLWNNFLLLVELRRWSAWLCVVFSSLFAPSPSSFTYHPCCFGFIHVTDTTSPQRNIYRWYMHTSPAQLLWNMTFSVLHILPSKHEFDFSLSFCCGRILFIMIIYGLFIYLFTFIEEPSS